MAETEFTNLCSILDTLLGPNGCPWDQKQTLLSLREYVLEETCELIDAIQEHDTESIKEELGDLFFNAVFLAKVAAKEGHFKLEDTLKTICDKLIRRHPHIFSDAEALSTPEEVLIQWEEIKKKEAKAGKNSIGGVPKSMPALSQAKKIISKMKKRGEEPSCKEGVSIEEQFGKKLFDLVAEAEKVGIDAELALRKVLPL